MFLGRHGHNLDDKGRLALPARYRALVDAPPYRVRRSEGIVELRERASERRGQAVPSA